MIALCSVSVRKGCNQRHLQVTSALTARRAVTALCSGAGGGVKGKKKKEEEEKARTGRSSQRGDSKNQSHSNACEVGGGDG